MGREGGNNSSSKSKKKSKGRMSYLKRNRRGRGGGGGGGEGSHQEAQVDEHGQLYGDYEPVNYHGGRGRGGRWRNNGHGHHGGGGGYHGGEGGGGGWNQGWRGGYRKKPKLFLEPGMKGFFCTTSSVRVGDCVRETYNILNEYYDQTEEGKKEAEERKLEEAAAAAKKKEVKEKVDGKDSGDAKKEELGDAKMEVEDAKKEVADVKKEEGGQVEKMECESPADEGKAAVVEESEAPGKSTASEEAQGMMEETAKEGAEKDDDDDDDDEEGEENMDVQVNVKAERKDKDIDVDDELANELKDLKSEKTMRRFQCVETGVSNVIFISTTIDDPVKMACQIFEEVVAKGETKSKSLLRFLPIELTCCANNMDEVKPKMKEMIEKYLKTGYVSYKVAFNSRYNNKVPRDDFIITVAEMVSQINPLSFVDLNNPQYTIVVEILKAVMCVSVLQNFTKYRRYNLLEAGMPAPPPKPSVAPKAKDAEKAAAASSDGSSEKLENGEGQDQTKAELEKQAKTDATVEGDQIEDSGKKVQNESTDTKQKLEPDASGGKEGGAEIGAQSEKANEN